MLISTGAKAWKNEKDKLVDDQNQVSVELVEEEGKYYLRTNVYDVMKAFKVGIIDSDLLGCAFEPEQRFRKSGRHLHPVRHGLSGRTQGRCRHPRPFASAEAAANFSGRD